MHYQRLMHKGTTSKPDKPVAICKVDDCDRELVGSIGRGMCSKHYQRWRKNGTTDALVEQWWHEERGVNPSRCTITGCGKPQKSGGLCSMHDTRARRDYPESMCEWCWSVFVPRRTNQRHCSDDCAHAVALERNRLLQRQWRKDNPREPSPTFSAKCAFCHRGFAATRRRYMYCSTFCWKAHRARGDDPYSTRRKQRQRDATAETFNKVEVFERDSWICWLCEEPIDREAVFPDGLSASLDHVIPLSRGGEHSRANTKCAHLRCNCKKSAKLITA